MHARRRFAVIFNASAGSALPRMFDGVMARLRANGGKVFQLPARSAVEAAERTAEAAATNVCDAVISAGGDGTFRAVATGAAGTALPVGVIPLGTGNVLGHELGLPRTAAGVADVILHGPELQVQAGLVNGAPFFLMVGAGFDGRVIARLNYAAKRLLGRAAFTHPVVKTLAEGPIMFDVAVDGVEMRASWVVVSRASRYGGGFKLTGDACVGANDMIAVIIAAETRRQLVAASLALARGRLCETRLRPAFVQVLKAQSVYIGRGVKISTEIDGDAADGTPVEIHRDGPLVRIIAPPGYAPGC